MKQFICYLVQIDGKGLSKFKLFWTLGEISYAIDIGTPVLHTPMQRG